MRYKDPDENDNEPVQIDNTVKIPREFVKARLHSKSVIINLPTEVREPLGIYAGSKLLITCDKEKQALIITKE